MQPQTSDIRTVNDAIHWIYDSYNRAKPTLRGGADRDIRHPEWTTYLLSEFGRPDLAGYNVAVTGSKGKGSHALLLAGMLQQLGFRVGLFTGPHLVDYLERCRVNGEIISEEEFVDYIRAVARRTAEVSLPQGQYFGPVGLIAVVAALWFRDKHTDVNVIELGRGALHDDVNRLCHQGAVMTPVFEEHVRELGPTLADIATEKAGVLTPETAWLSSHSQSELVKCAIAKRSSGRVDVRYSGDTFGKTYRVEGETLEVTYPEATYHVTLPVTGGYFEQNAVVALDAARNVWRTKHPGQPMPTQIDLSTLRLPGRMEVIDNCPLTIVDGTIHAQSARYLAEWIDRQTRGRDQDCKVFTVLSVPADKDGEGVVRQLAPFVDTMIFTAAHNPHLKFDTSIYAFAQKLGVSSMCLPYLEDAVRAAALQLSDQDILVLAGTQSFVGDVLRHYKTETTSIWKSASARSGGM